jgi:hypothetical protein
MRKEYIAKTILTALLLGSLAVASAASPTLLDEAKALPWQTQNVTTLKALFRDKASVKALLTELKPDLAGIVASVGEYEITDLNNNGELELVATIDVTGRAIYNTIYVVHKAGDSLEISELWAPGTNVLDLKSRIVDLNRDGAKELLMPRALATPEFGTDPRPIINDVYVWDGTKLRQANASFKGYYRGLLPRLQSKLEEARQGKTGVEPFEQHLLEEAYQQEIAEVQRILVTE